MSNRNDCYECPYRENIHGSAHSKCTAVPDDFSGALISLNIMKGNIKNIYNKEDKLLLKFDPHGVKHGWCTWPINFDPVWVECYLPIEKA